MERILQGEFLNHPRSRLRGRSRYGEAKALAGEPEDMEEKRNGYVYFSVSPAKRVVKISAGKQENDR